MPKQPTSIIDKAFYHPIMKAMFAINLVYHGIALYPFLMHGAEFSKISAAVFTASIIYWAHIAFTRKK